MSDPLERLATALSDRYAIERELGRGGMAVVYLAEDLKHHRKVAVKVLRPELAESLGAERFLREVEVTAQLNHPHILPLLDSGEANGFLFYVMPYVEGETLRERITREARLPIGDALQITQHVAAGLGYAHSHGVIHRDIKPENIMLSAGEAVVADFGIARAVSEAGVERLTQTGLTVGTPAYMSPEQASGEYKLDGRSDVYALGCVLYEMLSGEVPYTAPTPQALIAKKLAEPTPRISVVRETVPAAVEEALTTALAKTPADRYVTAQQFADALAAEVVVARAGGSRWPLRAFAAAVVGVVIVAVWLLSNVLGGPAYERLAVLPPANLMNDPEQDYFVQGMHTALISELQRAGVAVIGRTSVLQYENTQKPIREIASELGVDALVEASVLRAGDSVEIEVRLVDGTTQQAVADPIVRGSDLRDIERLYRGLTAAIASEIQLALTPRAQAHLASAPAVNPQAYETYLKGQSQWQRMTNLDRALEYFQQALSLDSTFALAHAGIALYWWARPVGGGRARASAAIHRALALDSTLVEVQYALALVRTWLEWDWEGGEAAFRKAIEINPNYAEARAFYAAFLYIMERPEEGRAQMERALELDPFNSLSRAMNGRILCYSHRRYAEAIEQLEGVLRIEPNHVVAIRNLVEAYHLNGNYDEALALIRSRLTGDQELAEALEEALDRGYAEGGYRAALRRYAEALAAHWEEPQDHLRVVMAYAMAGEKERTLDWLELAYQVQNINLPARVPATGGGLLPYDDPRYQALRRRMGLPER